MSKSPKQLPNCIKESKHQCQSNLFFIMVSSVMSMLILLQFFTPAQHESGTRKTISWSVTLYLTKMYPVNTILNAEIEPVQDKKEL
jgi:hypothetical protein